MADIQYTPVTLWQNFDKADVETEINVVRIKNGGRLSEKFLYFWGSAKGPGFFARASDRPAQTRVYAEYCRPLKKAPDKSLAGIILISEPGDRKDYGLMKRLAKEGYAVLWPDLDGAGDVEKLASTKYSPEAAYACYTAAAAHGFAFNDPKQSCWYEWAAVTMRAVTVLSAFPEIDPLKIGVIAIGKACDIAAMAGYKDERINRMCMVAGDISGCAYSDEYVRKQYVASLSFRAYAQHIKCALLYMGATNESAYDITEACEILSRVPPQTGSSLLLSERLDHEISFAHSGNIELWFGEMKKGMPPPARPSVSFRVSEDKFYCVLNVFPTDPVASVKAFVSRGDGPARLRNWHEIAMQGTGEGEFVAQITLYEGVNVSAFASVAYADGLTLSTRIISKNPADLKLPMLKPENRRLIYNADSGTGSFTTVFNGELLHGKPNVVMREGPLGLKGVGNNMGCLASYILGDVLRRSCGDETLLLDMAVEKNERVVIVIRGFDGGEYFTETDITAGAWQKTALDAKMFKTAAGMPLSGFDKASLLYFKAESPVLIGSVLWT